MSAILFSSPATWVIAKGPTSWANSSSAKPRMSGPDTVDVAREARLVTQLTVGVLSHNVPNASLLITGEVVTMTATAITSAASSKSGLVSLPFGLSHETTSFFIYDGNITLHTICAILFLCRSENHTPPAPSDDASCVPTYCGPPGTSSSTWVGLRARSHRSSHRSSSADRTSDCILRPITAGTPFRALLIGVNIPWAAGIINAVCLSLPTTAWNFLIRVHFLRSIFCVSTMYFFYLASGCLTVRRLPSKVKSIISLMLALSASPFATLFSEIGCFPFLCWVISGGGNTEWIPGMVALLTNVRCHPSLDCVPARQKSST